MQISLKLILALSVGFFLGGIAALALVYWDLTNVIGL